MLAGELATEEDAVYHHHPLLLGQGETRDLLKTRQQGTHLCGLLLCQLLLLKLTHLITSSPLVLGRGHRYFSAWIGVRLCSILYTNFREPLFYEFYEVRE